MSRVRYQKRTNPETGDIAILRVENGDVAQEALTVSPIPEHGDLASEVTAMLNALQMRKDFDAHRINSMPSVQDDDLVRLTGDEHGAALPVLQQLAREVGKAVLRWAEYAEHLWALLTPPEPLYVPLVEEVRGAWRTNLSQRGSFAQDGMPQGAEMFLVEELKPLRALYGHAMANVRAYENFLGEVEKRIDQEFGHLPRPSADGPVRQGSKQSRNLYFHSEGGETGGEFVAVVLDPHRAPLFKTALNEYFANHPEEKY